MAADSELVVQLHDGLRLAGALLAAGAWPEREQAARAYKPHRVAEGARRELTALRAHPAVTAADELGVEALFTSAFTGHWPDALAPHLPSFAADAQLERLRGLAQADWDGALADLSAVLAPADLGGFLNRLLGPNLPALTIFPNLLYPGHDPVTVLTPQGWLLCLPPPPAWGASPPWRYSERPDEVLASAAEPLARAIFTHGLTAPQAALSGRAEVVGLAAATLFVRAADGPEAAAQFMLMAKRTRRQPALPAVVDALDGRHGLGECVEALLSLSDGI